MRGCISRGSSGTQACVFLSGAAKQRVERIPLKKNPNNKQTLILAGISAGFPEMTDIFQLVSEAGKRTLPTLCQLSENDIGSIWANVSVYIERQMTLQKGVHLAGLGTFTFSQQKLDIGSKFTMIQRPIFLLAGKLAQSLGLKQPRPVAAATHLPVVQLNFTAVSQETPFSRDVVEGCVRETLLLLVRALASEQIVTLPLQGIGVLSFKNNKVRMKFNRDFINAMDGSGRLHLAFNNRPGSSASLMSGGLSRLQRPQTANHIALPTVCSPQPDNKAGDKEGWCLSPAPDQRNAQEVSQQRESKSHQTLQPAKMKAVNLSEELNPKPPMEATDKPTTISPPEVTPKLEEPHVNAGCSGHARAGQELCYLCMQRAQRNVPVYLREQQQTEEKAQERLLLFKELQRDKQFMEKEQAKLHEHREHAKQVAAFNLQMSEKKEKTYCPLYPTSFIFPARPLTPARRMKQNRYMNELQSQIESQRQHKAQDQQNCLLMEHLDQVQLVQEIALQKAQQLQQKQEKTKHYKKALDTQVEDKKVTDLPEFQPDKSGFSRCETPAANAESRERAQKQLFQVNFSVATQRKKEELHNRQVQLEKEREMLKHNQMELILDRINRFEKKRNISKSLESEWSLSATLKHQREEEERRFLRSAGQLLVDKLAQYRRCCQCKRRTSNSGETNIWKDSHYLSGSQFMI
ncbi:coiled-coil domain-containing protein 81-like isoform X1 [Thunnus albacares]|uniref:coiled-coil domain-containing protein 81-like isoform X1 n=1 Tax=Thunnus albacares TaxID=8236 RepID=UPI001CF64862|nr:coiled-coil domain-containing protein 81-like isoform X1 [Thunnus albacares]